MSKIGKTGLKASIYEPKGFKNCSNNGVSARFDHVVVLPTPEFPISGPFEPNEQTPAVTLKRNSQGDIIAVPVDAPGPESEFCGPMFGGAYICTSDSRFSQVTKIYAAIPLHDRWETWQQYNRIS